MNSKLIRQEYYDEDHQLNEQEYKEFNFVRIDPYWKVRACVYDLTLNCFDTKEKLIKKVESHLYNRYMNKKIDNPTALKLSATDIETMVKNLKCKSIKFEKISLAQLEETSKKNDLQYAYLPDLNNQSNLTPWSIVPELTKMEKTYSYPDIYKGMAKLMRPCMVFYNHFEEHECLNGIVALPFTPKMLDYLNPLDVYNMIQTFGMRVKYEATNIMDILTQKLLDLFYLVEDVPRIHGILPCQCNVRPCHNIASTYCANHMCKICCQDAQHKKPCIIHDRYDQFFRYKLRSVYGFEESFKFDRSRTLRLHCRKLVRKQDLKKAFEGIDVDLDNEKHYTHYSTHRLEYIYLVFKTQKLALEVLEQKNIYTVRLEKYDVRISAMSTSLYSQAEKYGELNAVAIIKPLSTLEVVEEIPSGKEYLEKIHELVQMITRLGHREYEIEVDKNPINDQDDDRHVFVKLPKREHMDALYRAQPLLGCLVVAKMPHIQCFSFLRYHPDQCMMCSSKKDPICVQDMCPDCCSRQMYGVVYCKCSKDIQLDKQIHQMGSKEVCCKKCGIKSEPECKNNLCFTCCPIQAIRNDCSLHDQSFYCKELKKIQ